MKEISCWRDWVVEMMMVELVGGKEKEERNGKVFFVKYKQKKSLKIW